jgi:transposase
MTAEERITWLEEQLKQALMQVQDLQEQLAAAHQRIEELEKQKTPPAFVKPNVVKPAEGQKKARKKRKPEQNGVRRREQPTQIVEHRPMNCPLCQLRLGGISLARVRQVIEVPAPPAVEVSEHRIYKGWCAGCGKWREAPVNFHEQVLGRGRLGVRLSSIIAYLRTVMRLPIRQIRDYLLTLHGLRVSVGEIVELLHRIKGPLQSALDALKAEIRASPAVQADETGWREDGSNGYIWSVSTPTIRYYEYHHSRGGEVVKQLIGSEYEGVLGSDFYAAYNAHQGLHQRCWVHFLRDMHELKEQFPHDEELLRWAKGVKAIYEQAIAAVEKGPDKSLPPRNQEQARQAQQHAFEQHLWRLCQPYVRTTSPQHTLCERVERFLPELFVFVAVPGVPSHNNLAERSVRPLVIARKISGGTRSPKGSATRMALFSLFGTWMAQGCNPFTQCFHLLSLQTPLPQV